MKKLYTVMAIIVITLLVLASCAPAATEAPAKKLKVGVVTDVGQLEDKSFNQAAYEGAKAAAEKMGADFDVIVTQNISDYKQNIQTFVDQGFNVIVTVGFLIGTDTTIAAKENPNVKFIGVDQGICVDEAGAPRPRASRTRAPMFRAIGKFLHWIWSGLDGLRKVLHLLLLLVIFGILWSAFSRSIPLVPDKAALVIAPQGPLVEQLSGDPLERALAESLRQAPVETLLSDVVDAIESAAGDEQHQRAVPRPVRHGTRRARQAAGRGARDRHLPRERQAGHRLRRLLRPARTTTWRRTPTRSTSTRRAWSTSTVTRTTGCS